MQAVFVRETLREFKCERVAFRWAMVDADTKLPSALNVVAGFSQRFTALLDRAGFPEHNRFSAGAERFDVVPSTFRNWCVEDRPPGKHSVLLSVVATLLKDIPGQFDPNAIAAWLLAGDAVPNPFNDDDSLMLVELYVQIEKLAKREKIDMARFPRKLRQQLLKRIYAKLPANAVDAEKGLQLDGAMRSMVVRLLRATVRLLKAAQSIE